MNLFLATLAAISVSATAQDDTVHTTRRIGEAEAIIEFSLREKMETYHAGAGNRQPAPKALVDVIDGDLRVAGDLLVDWERDRATLNPAGGAKPGDRPAVELASSIGLIVTGDLHVQGAIINSNLNGGPFLLVLGKTRARTLYAGGAEFHFAGDARFEDAIVGCYNDGYTRFAGDVNAPLVISEDHAFDLRGARPPYFDPFNGDGDIETWSEFLNEAIAPDADHDSPDGVEVEASLLPAIRSGQTIFVSRMRE